MDHTLQAAAAERLSGHAAEKQARAAATAPRTSGGALGGGECRERRGNQSHEREGEGKGGAGEMNRSWVVKRGVRAVGTREKAGSGCLGGKA
jgi:hypothetical protein